MNPLVFLVLAILPPAGFLAGAAIAKNRAPRPTRAETKELAALRRLRDDLILSSGQHMMLGDNYAVIVNDRLGEFFREVNP